MQAAWRLMAFIMMTSWVLVLYVQNMLEVFKTFITHSTLKQDSNCRLQLRGAQSLLQHYLGQLHMGLIRKLKC